MIFKTLSLSNCERTTIYHFGTLGGRGPVNDSLEVWFWPSIIQFGTTTKIFN